MTCENSLTCAATEVTSKSLTWVPEGDPTPLAGRYPKLSTAMSQSTLHYYKDKERQLELNILAFESLSTDSVEHQYDFFANSLKWSNHFLNSAVSTNRWASGVILPASSNALYKVQTSRAVCTEIDILTLRSRINDLWTTAYRLF